MERLYIGTVAEMVDRKPGTIRKWEAEGVLPEALCPLRDERGRRYFRSDQVELIRQWIIDEDRRPGKGLASYRSPSPEKVAEHLANIRRPKGSEPEPAT